MKKIILFAIFILLIGSVSAATIPQRYTLDFYGQNGIRNVTNVTYADGTIQTTATTSSFLSNFTANQNISSINTYFKYVQVNNGTDLAAKVASCPGNNGGCTIYIPSGTYTLSQTLYINTRSVKIIGAGRVGTIIRTNGTGFIGNYLIYVNNTEVSISDVMLEAGSGVGDSIVPNLIYSGSTAGRYSDITLRNFQGSGMTFNYSYYNLIENPYTIFTNATYKSTAININFADTANQNTIIGGQLCGDIDIMINNSDEINVLGTALECDQTGLTNKIGVYITGSNSRAIQLNDLRWESTNQTYNIWIDSNVLDVNVFGGQSTQTNTREPLVYIAPGYGGHYSQFGQYIISDQLKAAPTQSMSGQWLISKDSVTSTKVLDSSSNLNDLTINGDVVFNSTGRNTGMGALKFGGTGAYLSTTNTKGSDSQTFSIRAIIRLENNNTGDDSLLIQQTNSTNGRLAFYAIHNMSTSNGGKLRIIIYNGTNVSQSTQTFSSVLLTNFSRYYEVVATYNGTRLCQYVDGVRDGNCGAAVGYILGNFTGATRWGYDSQITGKYFNGSIALMEYYPYALNEMQVRNLYVNGVNQNVGADLNRANGGEIVGAITATNPANNISGNKLNFTTGIISNITMTNGTSPFCLKVNSSNLLQLVAGSC